MGLGIDLQYSGTENKHISSVMRKPVFSFDEGGTKYGGIRFC